MNSCCDQPKQSNREVTSIESPTKLIEKYRYALQLTNVTVNGFKYIKFIIFTKIATLVEILKEPH